MLHRQAILSGMAVGLCLIATPLRADETYKSADGLFRFVMPAEPKQSTENVADAKMDFHIHVTPTGVYMVTVMDLPPAAAKESDDEIQARLAGGVKKFSDSVAGKVLEEKKFTFAEKYPAREFTISANPGGMEGAGRGRIYAARGRLVQMFVLGEKSWVNDADKLPFLNSLQVIEPKAPAKR